MIKKSAFGLLGLSLLSSIASAQPAANGQAAWDESVQTLGGVLTSSPVNPIPTPVGHAIVDVKDKRELIRKITFTWEAGPNDREAKPEGVFYYYTSPEVEAQPLILLFPITGDLRYKFKNSQDEGLAISAHFCRYLFKNGYRCAYMDRKLPDEKDLPLDLVKLSQLPGLPPYTVSKAKRGLDKLEELGILKPGEKIGVGGISLGSMDAAVLALTDKRVAAAALLLGGGNLPMILTRTHGAGVGSFQRLKEKIKAANNWTDEQYQEALVPLTAIGDPLTYARDPSLRTNNLPGDRFLMINAAGDTAIPNASSRELCQALSQMDGSRATCKFIHIVSFLPKLERHVGIIADEYFLRPHHESRMMLKHFNKFLKADQ